MSRLEREIRHYENILVKGAKGWAEDPQDRRYQLQETMELSEQEARQGCPDGRRSAIALSYVLNRAGA